MDKLSEAEKTIKAAEAIDGNNDLVNELKKALATSREMAGDAKNPD